MIVSGLDTSILARAAEKGLISFNALDIREYSKDKHRHVDDYPYGGGAGMVMKCQPVYDAFIDAAGMIAASKLRRLAYENGCGAKDLLEQDRAKVILDKKPRVLYTSPAGKTFTQEMAVELANEEELIILCGHYEGVDERVLSIIEAEPVSIGDYVLTGGELAAMVMTDAISRMVPGVLSNEESGVDESFSYVYPHKELTKKDRRDVYGGLLGSLGKEEGIRLLEYPQYTRPETFMGLKAPGVLLSGNHASILKWRRKQSIERTKKMRPDLMP